MVHRAQLLQETFTLAIPTYVSSTYAEQLDDSETVISLTSGSNYEVGDYIVATEASTEVMYIASKASNDLTVTRAQFGSTANAHNDSGNAVTFALPLMQTQAGDMVVAATVRITTGFNGVGPTLTVGDWEDLDGFVASSDITESAAGTYGGTGAYIASGSPGRLYTSAIPIIAHYTPSTSGGTVGGARVTILFWRSGVN